jgi:FkbH-like protein
MFSAASALTRAEWQTSLFGPLSRANLARCAPDWPLHLIRVRVHRNHGFEPVSSACAPFAAWNGLAFAWTLGAYDDSLSFEMTGDADVEVVWFDMTRVEKSIDASWLADRLGALRASTDHPILALAWPLSASERAGIAKAQIPGLACVDLDPIAAALPTQWLDERALRLSGTRLSNKACLQIARALACQWLPAVTLPPRKAVAVDLDGTLYRGVLAEEGPIGVQLTPAHRELQARLVALREAGVLLALVSRNERADVEQLFAERADFPLRLEHFSALEMSWDDKAVALRRACETMRIGADAVVFVDDNAGELAAIAAALPVLTVHAIDDARQTLGALDHVAGIFRFARQREDTLRAGDLTAAALRRDAERSAASPDDYLRSLDVRLVYAVDRPEHLPRMAELCAKTNQFNLSLRRMNEVELARALQAEDTRIVTITLTDRLSDSGIVGLVVGCRDGDALRIAELCVSCRALGRRIEDTMLTQAVRLLAQGWSPQRVLFDVRLGPRNLPAREWLERYADLRLEPDAMQVPVPFARFVEREISPAVRIRLAA